MIDTRKAFYDYIHEDKSVYPTATDKGFYDPDGDFLVGDSGGFLMNINFIFVHTHKLRAMGAKYEATGKYTDFTLDSPQYIKFLHREEARRKDGYTADCKLLIEDVNQYRRLGKEGKFEEADKLLKPLRITGEQYNFINYGTIRKLDRATILSGKITAEKKEGIPEFFDAQYWYMKSKEFAINNGFHMIVGKSRRAGYSFMEGVDSANIANLYPKSLCIHGAYDKKYVTQEKALSDMALKQIQFYETQTPFNRCPPGKKLLSGDVAEIVLGYKSKAQMPSGWQSAILSYTHKDNDDAAAGKDAKRIKFDELNKFPNIRNVLKITEPTTRTGSFTTGLITCFGTGGSKEGNWLNFEYLFFNPKTYHFMPFENVWDKDERDSICGFYKPFWWSLEGITKDGKFSMDIDGNSDYAAAMEIQDAEREAARRDKGDSDFIDYISQYSNCPSESFSNATDNLFTSPELKEHLNNLKFKDEYKYYTDGTFLNRDGLIVYRSNIELKSLGVKTHNYITDVPFKADTDITGCVRIYGQPHKIAGVVPPGIYCMVIDPFGVDKDQDDVTLKNSLYSFQVYQLPNQYVGNNKARLVAAYTGRLGTNEDCDKLAYYAAVYYNCIGLVLPEVDRGEVVKNFKMFGGTKYLMREPTAVIKDSVIVKEGTGFGINIGGGDKKYKALLAYRDFLYSHSDVDENGDPIYNFMYIDDLPLITELSKYKLKGNFDRVSAAILFPFIFKNDMIKARNKVVRSKSIHEEIGLYNFKT